MNTEQLKELIQKIRGSISNRADIVQGIREYNALVHARRHYDTSRMQNTTAFAIEDSIQPFVEDAVKTTFAMTWDSIDAPFRIVHNDKEIAEQQEVFDYYTDVTWIMQKKLNEVQSNFKFSFEQVLKMLFEHGTAISYIVEHNKSFFSDTYSLEHCFIQFDTYKQVEAVCIAPTYNKTILFYRKTPDTWEMYVLEEDKITFSTKVNYQPVFVVFGQPPNVNQTFPVGHGIASLPEIRKINSIIGDITYAAAESLKPQQYMDSAVNLENRSTVNLVKEGGRTEGPLLLSVPPGTSQLPIGYIQSPNQPGPAWELWNQMMIKLREKFGFINRLLTLKDNVEITATEATIRSRADLNQVKNLLDNIFFRFLTPLHLSQMKILDKARELPVAPAVLNGKKFDVSFMHNSIFQRQEENQRLSEIRNGTLLINELLQVASNAQNAGMTSVSYATLVEEVSRLLRLPTTSFQPGEALSGILGQLAEAEQNAEVLAEDAAA